MKQIPSIISLSRVIVSTVFYAVVVLNKTNPFVILFTCFILIELSDLLDGLIARRLNLVSDLGKLLDPICDVTAHFMCIFALYQVDLVPPLVIILFVIRESWIQLLRSQLIKKNIVLAANWAGKLKTWSFGIAIFSALLLVPGAPLFSYALEFRQFADALFYLAAFISVFSGLQYFMLALRHFRN